MWLVVNVNISISEINMCNKGVVLPQVQRPPDLITSDIIISEY